MDKADRWRKGSGDWADAYAKARALVADLTLVEKVNLTTLFILEK